MMVEQIMGYDPFNMFLFLSVMILLGFFVLLFGVSIFLKNNNVVDLGWGLGFPLLAWMIYFFDENVTSVQMILNTLVTIWGLRLTIYLAIRSFKAGEDWRYRNLRKSWYQNYYINAFLKIYMLQAISMLIVTLPLIYVAGIDSNRISIVQATFILIWTIGFYLESLADLQLYQFKSNSENNGRLLTKGVWGLSRHPNYLGEMIMWWSVAIISVSDLSSIWVLVAPFFLTIMIYKVTGVKLMEKKLKGYEGYIDYMRKTRAVLPNLRLGSQEAQVA